MTIIKIEEQPADKFVVGKLYFRKESLDNDIFMYCQTGQKLFNMIDLRGIRYSYDNIPEESFYNLYSNTFFPFSGTVTLSS